jgi:N-acetylmuramoyl-L-alanine amidase
MNNFFKVFRFPLILLFGIHGSLFAKSEAFLLNHRIWSTDSYSRVVFYLSEASEFSLTKKSAREWQVMVTHATVPKFLSGNLKVNEPLIQSILAQNEKDSLRLTIRTKVDLVQVENFLFHEPVRIVLDLYQAASSNSVDPVGQLLKEKAPRVKSKSTSIIVLDPGHGGKDPGTTSQSGLQEKNITLSISRKIKAALQVKGIGSVFLTRESDESIDLDERTYFANSKNADLFVSIHANSSHNKKSQGLQTFYLNLATDRASTRLAQRENLFKKGSTIDMIKLDLEVAMHTNRSAGFAESLHKQVYKNLSRINTDMQDFGVKPALFYVLWGARMPSILVETGFLSHAGEAKKLASASYQEKMAQAIADGIAGYLSTTKRS